MAVVLRVNARGSAATIESLGVYLLWAFVAGFHALEAIPFPAQPSVGLVIFIALPSAFLAGYSLFLGATVRRLLHASHPTWRKLLGLVSLAGIHAALAAVASLYFRAH